MGTRLTFLAVLLLIIAGCGGQGSGDGTTTPEATADTTTETATVPDTQDVPAPEVSTDTAASSVPEQCLPAAKARRGDLQGAPVWVQFCPGVEGLTAPAEIPSDALITHLDSLEALGVDDLPATGRCRARFSRNYRLQVGFSDGTAGICQGG